jgi:hypothetical protein
LSSRAKCTRRPAISLIRATHTPMARYFTSQTLAGDPGSATPLRCVLSGRTAVFELGAQCCTYVLAKSYPGLLAFLGCIIQLKMSPPIVIPHGAYAEMRDLHGTGTHSPTARCFTSQALAGDPGSAPSLSLRLGRDDGLFGGQCHFPAFLPLVSTSLNLSFARRDFFHIL